MTILNGKNISDKGTSITLYYDEKASIVHLLLIPLFGPGCSSSSFAFFHPHRSEQIERTNKGASAAVSNSPECFPTWMGAGSIIYTYTRNLIAVAGAVVIGGGAVLLCVARNRSPGASRRMPAATQKTLRTL